MKKNGILNKDICEVIASMGHTDTLVVCDAGLPIPAGVRRIDLAIKPGLPGFMETAEAIANELEVDRIIIAEETEEASPEIISGLKKIFQGVDIQTVPHAELKELSHKAKAIVRTGEFTSYANVIIVSGVVF